MLVEIEIVRLLKLKDPTAIAIVYDLYSPALFGMILKLTPNHIAATKILEESFLKFQQLIESYDTSKERLFIWMVCITIKQSQDVLQLSKEMVRKKLEQQTSHGILA
jgi:RNA polymerase sigma-70 factor (ECF subfamily)